MLDLMLRGGIAALAFTLLGLAAGAAPPAEEKPPPTRANVRYGPHADNRLDFWQAEADAPTPVVLFIHGGGWNARDKSVIKAETLKALLAAGISVAAVDYRLLRTAPFPAPFLDVARAVQFVRYRAGEWGLDSRRFGAYGGSAGGCMSLWLAYHDDLADPNSEDPVARQSTRLRCAAGQGAQTSVDPFTVAKWLGSFILQHPNWLRMYGVAEMADLRAPKYERLRRDLSPIEQVGPGDPPVFLEYGGRDVPLSPKTPLPIAIHHPRFGDRLKAKTDRLGLVCLLRVSGRPPSDDYRGMVDFFRRQFAPPPPAAGE